MNNFAFFTGKYFQPNISLKRKIHRLTRLKFLVKSYSLSHRTSHVQAISCIKIISFCGLNDILVEFIEVRVLRILRKKVVTLNVKKARETNETHFTKTNIFACKLVNKTFKMCK